MKQPIPTNHSFSPVSQPRVSYYSYYYYPIIIIILFFMRPQPPPPHIPGGTHTGTPDTEFNEQ